VPSSAAEAARSSVSSGVAAASQSGQLLESVRSSFIYGMDVVLVVCALVCFAAVVLAFFYRDHTVDARPDTAPEPDAGAAQSLHEHVS
jgi:hypothetical protein